MLKATLQFPIVEDKDTLEGVTWREARKKFNTWVPQDIKNNPLTPTAPDAPALLAKDNFKQDLETGTHWNYFIYLDEASLTSVLDTPTPLQSRRVSPGDYWFSVVDAEAGETPEQRFPDNNGVIPERSLAKAGMMWQDIYEKKFKVPSFVSVYSEIIDENYGFEGFPLGPDGLSKAR